MAFHRGISQVVGSLFMLAVVIPIGVIILSNGMTEVAEFNQKLSVNNDQQINSVQEDVIFEHIRFVPSSNEVIISVRNSGTVETGINKISIVKMDTQELIVSETNLAPFLSLKDYGDITVNGNLALGGNVWDDPNYRDSDYKISLITSRGNFFDTIARPFNT